MNEKVTYRIHPAIGVGRLGNSPNSFYLAPETIGGLPIEPDDKGLPILKKGKPEYVTKFKDDLGMIRRQAATFKIYRSVNGGPEEVVDLNDKSIDRIEWTVHVANKKAAWWNFVPLLGDLMFGKLNSYETWNKNPPKAWNLPTNPWSGLPWMELRNSSVTKEKARQALIVDPGPKTLSKPNGTENFDKNNPSYPFVSFPNADNISQGLSVKTLGEMRTDPNGNLLVLGAFGRAGGSETITGFGGGDTWNDDIADGPVTATIYFKDGTKSSQLNAWVVTGSPKFAPELVNISTWDDVIIDMAIKYKNALPNVYDSKKWKANDGWNPDFVVNYDKDIQPFLNRIADYQWVGTVPSMTAFIRPAFDAHDASEANREQREKFLSYFRKPSKIQQATEKEPGALVDGQSNQLFSDATLKNPNAGIPLMPMNSGTNSVRNNIPDKFSVITDTQYYCLKQWAAGKFSSDSPGVTIPNVHPLDSAAVGNCVGEPMCPGIEVTWSVRNPIIYDEAYRIKHAHDEKYYQKNGLNPNTDECEPIDWKNPTVGRGCEPGDLTKRMAIPWQADFYDCSVQMINFSTPTSPVKDNETGIPVPPNYYAYWWPPQSPWNVLSGGTTLEEQQKDGIPSGLQVMYSRGVNSFTQMITAWKYLGFIVNQNRDEKYGRQYPYFSEKERNYDQFQPVSVGIGNVTSFITGDDSNYLPAWFMKQEDQTPPNEKMKKLKLSSGLLSYHTETPKKIKEAPRGRRYGH